MSNSNDLAIIQTRQSIREVRELMAAGRELIPVLKNIGRETTAVNNLFKSGRPREYANGIANLSNLTRQYAAAQRELLQVTQRLNNVERSSTNVAYEESRAREAAARALFEESRARQQVAREQRQNANNSTRELSEYQRLKKEVRDATNRARDYGAEIIKLNRKRREGSISTSEYRTQLKQLSKDFNSSTKEALRLQRELEKLNKATSAYKQKNGALQGRVTDVLKALGISASIDNVASSFYRMAESAVQTSIKLDSLRLAQKSVFKTNEEVSRQNDFLSKTADRYGIEILGLTDAYTKFAASAQGTYLEGNRTQQIFDAVSRSSSLLGVTSDETSGILRALGQMMSKGKVQAEELRGQLGDRMAGAFKLFADGMGVSTAQLDKMLKKGEVLADDVLPKFAEQLNKKYQLDLDKQIETQTASINRRTNAWINFVENVNSGGGVITKSVLGFNAALTSMLEMLTPSKQVTIIEQEQAQLNMLGYELRQNWSNEKKRKDILDEMIKLNPFFINGLDKEHLTLQQISEQLQNVNDQYIQKIALEKQSEKIKELVEDQAQAYIYLNRIFVDHAVDYNNMNEATKQTLDKFKNGSLSYSDAMSRINKNTKLFSKENDAAREMLNKMNSVIAQSTLNFDGFNRGIDGNKIAIKNAIGEYESLKNIFGKMVDQQSQLIYMNGLTAKSYNSMGKEQQDTWKAFAEDAQKATLAGEKFFLFKNQWRAQNAKGGWFSTGKKGDDWYLEAGKLMKRQKAVIEKEPTKPKAATLSAAEKDFINTATGIRDMEVARLKSKRLDLKISDEEYWKGYEKVVKDYSSKITGYLKGLDAKEIQVRGAAFRKGVDAREQATKELYDIRTQKLESQNKKELNIIERASKQIEQSDYLTDTEKLDKQIELDGKSIEQLNKYYADQIQLAKSSAQSIVELEQKRDEEIGKIQDSRSEKFKSRIESLVKDLERVTTVDVSNSNKNYDEQKRLLILNELITNEERAYRLQLLEIDKQITQNNLEIKHIESLKVQYDLMVQMARLKGESDPGAEQKSAEFAAEIASLNAANAELNKEAKDLISDKTQKLRDVFAEGFKNLGFDHLADAYTATMDRLKNKTAEWKDFAVLAATAVLESLTKLNDAQKQKTIENLDEQLKHSQEVSEQEIGFIDGRLNHLNNLDELTKEQMAERNRLEDESRGLKEQQLQREKMIEAQKAKAEQKAAAQQALINGALAATATLAQMGFVAGAVPAALALGFGIAQSVAIMSKDPVPQYFVGTMNAKPGIAWRDERGAEIHTDKNDNIKSLGDNSGAKLVNMEAGDKVYTASQSKRILKDLGSVPKIGSKLFQKVALNSLQAPSFNIVVNKTESKPGLTYDQFRQGLEDVFSRYDKPSTTEIDGVLYLHEGAKFPRVIGKRDENNQMIYI